MSNEYPWINEQEIDYVEVNNLVNLLNVANSEKVADIDKDKKMTLLI